MSKATQAKNAKERAIILARYIVSGKKGGRAMSDCLEMGDGDEVIAHLRVMAQNRPKLRENWSRFLSVPLTVRSWMQPEEDRRINEETGTRQRGY